jgi:hypothetical protein
MIPKIVHRKSFVAFLEEEEEEEEEDDDEAS